ncbi:MAG: 4-alpha-glucanotransferase [Thermodesulfobacteriota bacterium]
MNDSETYRQKLYFLAGLKGIEPEYRDIRGAGHSIPRETLIDFLLALGCEVDSEEKLEREIEKEKNRDWQFLTAPTQVFYKDRLAEELIFQFPVDPLEIPPNRLPADLRVRMTIAEENGKQVFYSVPFKVLRFIEARFLDGVLYVRAGIPFPAGFPLGYHRIYFSLNQGGRDFEQTIRLIICPEQAYLPSVLEGRGKRAGLMVSLAGLRSRKNWGIGDFGDLKALIPWAIDQLKVGLIGLLPLHALSNQEPYNISPYYPSSRFYRNPVYLCLPEMEDFTESLKAQALVAGRENQKLLEELRASEKVCFEKVDRLKTAVLREVFQSFLTHHWNKSGPISLRKKSFLAYLEREGDLLDLFAGYCLLNDFFNKENPAMPTWAQWPAPYQDPRSAEVEQIKKEHRQELLFHKYLQWQVEIQLTAVQDLAKAKGAEIGLYHDLALGFDPWGADAWAWRDFTLPGIRVGAPPDDFAPQGQEWGFCPPNAEKNRLDGYRLFSREIRKNSFPGGALRIDHVMKLARLYWIKAGFPAGDGAYVSYPLEDYLKILTLESLRNRTLIIGEDLGTLPEGLREKLQSRGIFSYRLFYFEKDGDGNLREPEAYPEEALASISTHDLPTLAGFWSMEDILLRKRLGIIPDEGRFHQALSDRIREKRMMIDRLQTLGFLSPEAALDLHGQGQPLVTDDLHRAVLSFILAANSKLALISQEDLFLEKKQLNLPGTIDAYPNWSGKMRLTIEALGTDPETRKKAGLFRELVERFGRGTTALFP